MSTAADTVETADEVVDAVHSTAVATLGPLKKIEAGLAALKAEAKPFDLATTAGAKAARVFRAKCVSLRTAIDEAYENGNRPLLAIQRDARKLRDEIKDGVKLLEEPVDKAIKEDEAAREVERIRKAEAEANRIAALHERIDGIKAIAARAVGKPSTEIEQKIQLVVGMTIGETYQELKPAAEQAQASTLATLRELHAAAVAQEAESARLAAERADLDRRQAEQAEAQRVERERVLAEQAAQRKRIDDENEALRLRTAAFEEEQRQARQRREEEDRRAAAVREQADREARERREAEEQRQADARAQLRKEQEERDRKVREEEENRARAAREAAEAQARTEREAAEAEERRQAEIRAEARRQEELAAIADKQVRDAAHKLLAALQRLTAIAFFEQPVASAVGDADQREFDAAMAQAKEAIDAATVVDATIDSPKENAPWNPQSKPSASPPKSAKRTRQSTTPKETSPRPT